MRRIIGKVSFVFWIQSALALLVVGLFIVSCGSNDPTGVTNYCDSGYTYCRDSGKCCKDGYPYHCNSGDAAGTCYQSRPTNPPCSTYDYCSG